MKFEKKYKQKNKHEVFVHQNMQTNGEDVLSLNFVVVETATCAVLYVISMFRT